MKKRTSFIFLLITTIIIVFVLSSCEPNPETCVHSWLAPTCLNPAQCWKCETYKPDGELGNHNYEAATCREPAKCVYCYQYKDDNLGTHKFSEETGYCIYCGIPRDGLNNNSNNTADSCANGHTNSEWIITQQATLVNKGVEEMYCSVCNKLIDTQTVQKKSPQVVNNYFNFNDVELIEWLNDISTANVYNTDLGIFDEDSSNTSYKIVMSDGETGALLLNHGDNGKTGNIQAIMVYFENDNTSVAMGIWIGNKINSNFNTDVAINKLASNKSYTAANMTGALLELEDDFKVYLLAPSEYVADVLS